MRQAGNDVPAGPPHDFESLRDLVVAEHGRLPKRLAQVAQFVLDNPDEVALGTSAKIAQMAEVQPSTLVRFGQALGFAGFSDLQALLRERLRERWSDYGDRVRALQLDDETAAPPDLLDRFAQTAMNSLERLRASIRAEDMNLATQVLAGARTTYVLGQRRSFPVATYLTYAFQKLEHQVVLLDNTGGTIMEQAAFISPEDALLAISFTPYSQVTIDIANRVQQMGVPIVAISDSAFSPLASIAKVWLEVVETDLAGFRSLSATLCLAMALAIGSAERRDAGAGEGA